MKQCVLCGFGGCSRLWCKTVGKKTKPKANKHNFLPCLLSPARVLWSQAQTSCARSHTHATPPTHRMDGTPHHVPPLARMRAASPRAAAASPDALRALTSDLARRAGSRPSDAGDDEGVELDALCAVLRALHGAGALVFIERGGRKTVRASLANAAHRARW